MVIYPNVIPKIKVNIDCDTFPCNIPNNKADMKIANLSPYRRRDPSITPRNVISSTTAGTIEIEKILTNIEKSEFL